MRTQPRKGREERQEEVRRGKGVRNRELWQREGDGEGRGVPSATSDHVLLVALLN